MSVRRRVVALHAVGVLAVSGFSLAAGPTEPDLSDIVLTGNQREAVKLQSSVRGHRFTAVIFFSETCPCFAAHRARLETLVDEMAARDVRFVIVDSERRPRGEPAPASVPETDLPIFRDDEAKLARRLNAKYATETFVFDATGSLRYRGGIDDDRKHLSASPRARLRDELLALLAGTAAPFVTAKALGCALRLM